MYRQPRNRAAVGALAADRHDQESWPVISQKRRSGIQSALPDPIHHEALPLVFVCRCPARRRSCRCEAIRVVSQKKIGSGLSEVTRNRRWPTEFSSWTAVNCRLKRIRFGPLGVVLSRFGKAGPAANYGACVRFRPYVCVVKALLMNRSWMVARATRAIWVPIEQQTAPPGQMTIRLQPMGNLNVQTGIVRPHREGNLTVWWHAGRYWRSATPKPLKCTESEGPTHSIQGKQY